MTRLLPLPLTLFAALALAPACHDDEDSGGGSGETPAATPPPAEPAAGSAEAVSTCEQALDGALRGEEPSVAGRCRFLFADPGCRAALADAGGDPARLRDAAVTCIRAQCDAHPDEGWTACAIDLDGARPPLLRQALAELIARIAGPHLSPDAPADAFGDMVAGHIVPRPTVHLYVEASGGTVTARHGDARFLLPLQRSELARSVRGPGPECPDVLLHADAGPARQAAVGLAGALSATGCDRVVLCDPDDGNCD